MYKLIKRLKLNKGFTLLECVVAVAIIGIMCSAMMALFDQGIMYIAKSKQLDEHSSTAQQMVLTREQDYTSDDQNQAFMTEVPVKIQFTLYFKDGETTEIRQLREQEYNFQAALSQQKLGDSVSVKVVYFDMMQSELMNLGGD